MAGLDLATASGILKDAYAPKVREVLNNKVFLLAQLERNSDDTEMNAEGAEAVIDLHVSRSSGIGNIADGGTLPTPGNQKYTKQRVPLRTITGRIRFTVQTMLAMKTNAGAWERAATSETKRIANDLRRDVNRQLAGTSNGTIAIVAANAGVNLIQLHADTTEVQMRQFEVDMVVDISTAATPGDAAKASARTITAVDTVNKRITLSGAVITTLSGDRVERKGNGGAAGGTTQKEFTGLQTICSDTGTLHGVDPTLFPVWKAYVDNPGADRTPTENVFEKAIDGVDLNGGEIKLWMVSHGVRRGFSNQLTGQKRFNDTVDLKGGFKGLSVSAGSSASAMYADRDIPAKSAFGVDPEHMTLKEWAPLTWLEEEGGTVLRQTPDKLEYEATAYWVSDLTVDHRGAQAFVGRLTES